MGDSGIWEQGMIDGEMVAQFGESDQERGRFVAQAEMSEQLERTRLVALVERDMETADRLHAEAYQLITPGGNALSKAEYLGSILGGSLRYRVFEPVGQIALRISGPMAALRYRCHIEVMS